jgi:hypothetical protein
LVKKKRARKYRTETELQWVNDWIPIATAGKGALGSAIGYYLVEVWD